MVVAAVVPPSPSVSGRVGSSCLPNASSVPVVLSVGVAARRKRFDWTGVSPLDGGGTLLPPPKYWSIVFF